MKVLLIILIAPFVLCLADISTKKDSSVSREVNTKHIVSIRNKLLDKSVFGRGHLCAGSLISPNTVLTSAHCLRYNKAFHYKVVLGVTWQNVRDEYTLEYDVDSFVVHLNYTRNEKKISHDIALLFLAKTVPENHLKVHPIKLANSNMTENALCQVSGWGLTDKNIQSDKLLTVDVRIVDTRKCNESYDGQLDEGRFCAECMTGGGPLACRGSLRGIMSCGDECGKKNKLGIYTDVNSYRDWIEWEQRQHLKVPKFKIHESLNESTTSFYTIVETIFKIFRFIILVFVSIFVILFIYTCCTDLTH